MMISRRQLLSGATVLGGNTLLQPLVAGAEGQRPLRILLLHRPSGTDMSVYHPRGRSLMTDSHVLEPFAPVESDMILVDGVRAPRESDWPGDQHGMGLICMATGHRAIPVPGTQIQDPEAKNLVAPGPSFEQLMLDKHPALARPVGSVQLTAYPESASGDPAMRVLSHGGNAQPLWPEARPSAAYTRLFKDLAGADEQAQDRLAQLRKERRSVIDFLHADLARLRSLAPISQHTKLEMHLAGVRELETQLDGLQAAVCDPSGLSRQDAVNADMDHERVSRAQLAIIRTAFQCDVTRVASFTFAHGNSNIKHAAFLSDVNTFKGHHDLSHTEGIDALKEMGHIDRFYSGIVADFIDDLRDTPDIDGSPILDNTVVVYFNECSVGMTHGLARTPFTIFGGRNWGLNPGRRINLTNRSVNDVYTALAQRLGVDIEIFGGSDYNTTPISEL